MGETGPLLQKKDATVQMIITPDHFVTQISIGIMTKLHYLQDTCHTQVTEYQLFAIKLCIPFLLLSVTDARTKGNSLRWLQQLQSPWKH